MHFFHYLHNVRGQKIHFWLIFMLTLSCYIYLFCFDIIGKVHTLIRHLVCALLCSIEDEHRNGRDHRHH